MRRVRIAAALCALAAATAAPASAASGPLFEQMVVFRDGHAAVEKVRAAATHVRVRGRRCAVGRATPLAALVRSRVAKLRLRDFGSCSRRAVDGGGLFVDGIGRDRNSGRDGWVYKVGQRLATAGAADPDGPFGRGPLRSGEQITWFYCHLVRAACQPTLVVAPEPNTGGLRVRVRAFDDEARSKPAAGATVHAGAVSGVTDARGEVQLQTGSGRRAVFAESPGAIRSFPVRVAVP
jgi:hypothetical protein